MDRDAFLNKRSLEFDQRKTGGELELEVGQYTIKAHLPRLEFYSVELDGCIEKGAVFVIAR
jgi:hypothetical protein